MAEFTIRSMEMSDIEAVVRIQEAILKKKVSPTWRSALEHYINKDPKACLVAVKKNEPVGFIIGEIKIWGFGLRQSGWLVTISIHPAHMGTGTGNALSKHLIDYFHEMEVDGIYTTVRWDSGDLLSFFKSIGFTHSAFLNLEYKMQKREQEP